MNLSESAEYRAKELLCRVLPEDEWVRFTETGTLEVPGSRGTYRISPFAQTILVDSQTRRPIAGTCLQLSIPTPPHDRVIAEYILIRNNEDLYWQTANIFPVGLSNRDLMVFLAALLDVTLLMMVIVRLVG
jgi:hypothetical protein